MGAFFAALGAVLLFLLNLQDIGFPAFQLFYHVGDRTESFSILFCVHSVARFQQQNIELLAEFFYGTFDIAKAHAFPRNRCKLLLHGVCDLRHQCFMIRHCRVDCCQHCLLERRFVQRWGVHAVFLAIIQPAHTAPYRAFLAVLRPHDSAISNRTSTSLGNWLSSSRRRTSAGSVIPAR